MTAVCVARAHKWGHYLFEIRNAAGAVIAKVAGQPETVMKMLTGLIGESVYLQWTNSDGTVGAGTVGATLGRAP